MPDWPFFGCILYNGFGGGSNSVIVSGRLANLIMISEEHWKNDEILFQNVYWHRESVVLRVQVMLITYNFCDFLFHGYPCMTEVKTTCYSAGKIMKFILLIRDMPI